MDRWIVKTVYHGSDRIIRLSDVTFADGRDNCDFGKGFYLTGNYLLRTILNVDTVKNRWNCEPVTVRKMRRFAQSLPDDIDFADYWYNFVLSKTKEEIDSSIANNINAFHWTRWKEDFETYVDGYTPVSGDGLHDHWRGWFAAYTQPFIEVFDMPSREIFTFYGKEKFLAMLNMYPRAHCYGVDSFVDDVISELGAPSARGQRKRIIERA